MCARAFNHTGPGQPSAFLVPGLAARIAAAEHSGADEIVLGNGDPVRDFSDVRDVVRAYALLAEHGDAGRGLQRVLRSRRQRRRRRGRARRRARPARCASSTDGALVRPVDVPVLVGDPTKLTAATGWSPALDLDAHPRRRARGGAGYGWLTSTGVPLGTWRASQPRSVAIARGS